MKIKKSIWIFADTIADIEQEVKDRASTFPQIANERLRQRGDTQLPEIMFRTQSIINLCREGRIEEAQKEENELWKLLK